MKTRSTTLTGTGTLVRLVLRQDRVRIPVWIVAIAGFVLSSAGSLPDLYPTASDRQSRADLMDNPAVRAMTGPGYGTDDYTYGAMIANETISFAAILVALMSIFLVVRHTRAEEESGRAELLRATALGRHAMATATLVVVALANLVLGMVLALGLAASVEGLSFGSSLLFGAAMAAVGLVFAGVAVLTAQLSEYPRAANGLAAGVLGLAYALRAAGDVGNGALAWLSPIGWSQATKVYVDDRWWPLVLTVVLAAAAVAAGFALSSRRDLGAGLLAQKTGAATASEGLARPIGFALRLQRASLIGWAVGVLFLGMVYGTVANDVEAFVEDNSTIADMLRIDDGSVTDQFFGSILVFVALLSTGFALQATLRVRSEETSGRVEPVLATALARWRWAGSHLLVASVGTLVLLAVGGAGMGLTAALSLSDAGELPRLAGAALVHAPSVWLLVGLATALYGLAPRAAVAVWAVLGYSAFILLYGGLLDLPTWLDNLTPFGHTPELPAEGFDPVPPVVLTVSTGALTWLGLAAFRRRDLELS